MKTFYRILPWALLIIVASSWIYCENQKPQDIIIPGKSGTFAPILNPEPLPSVKATDTVRLAGEKIIVPAEINTELYTLYMESSKRESELLSDKTKALDSVQYWKEKAFQFQMVADALAINNYENTFSNNIISAKVKSKVQGKLLDISLDWETKPDTLKVKGKINFFAGAEAGLNYQSLKPSAKVNIFIQDKKQNLWSGSINTSKDVMVGRAWKF